MKKDSPKKGLGRGLSALLGDEKPVFAQAVPAEATDPTEAFDAKSEAQGGASIRAAGGPGHLPIALLQPRKDQPRQHFDEASISELAASISEKGVLQPILVRKNGPDNYEIIAGERRWRAAQLASVHEVPVVVKDLDEAEVQEIAIIENVQREDLSAIEEATAYQKLMDEFGHTQDAVAKIVGKSRSHVANLLRLLVLPEAVKALVAEGRISFGHARALIGQSDALSIAKRIIKNGLSVRDVEKLVAKKAAGPASPKRRIKDADTVALEKALSAATGIKTVIQHSGERGTVTLNYESLEELDEICIRLGVDG